MHDQCIPAGSRLLSATQIICPNSAAKCCVQCGKESERPVPCTGCSNVSHKKCLSLTKSTGRQCVMCTSGRLTYNDLVYAERRVGKAKIWWPAQVRYDYDARSDECGRIRVKFIGANTDELAQSRLHKVKPFGSMSIEDENELNKPGENADVDKAIRLAFKQLERMSRDKRENTPLA